MVREDGRSSGSEEEDGLGDHGEKEDDLSER